MEDDIYGDDMAVKARRAISLGLLPSDEHQQLFFQVGTFVFTPNGLAPPDATPPYVEWETAGAPLAVHERGAAFIVGDWVRYGESHYGEQAAQAIDVNAFSTSSLKVYRWLSENVPPNVRRMDRLTVRHHLAVARLPVAHQRQWLQRAAADDEEQPWTVKRLVEAIRQGQDPVEVGWWVLAQCASGKDQAALQKQLERKGRTCKPIVKRQYQDRESS